MKISVISLTSLSLLLSVTPLAAQDAAADRIRRIQEGELDSLQGELDRISADRGENHADLLPVLWAMRDVYKAHAAYVPAVTLMERALEITEAEHGEDGGVTLTGVHNLAELYVSAGDYARAHETVERLRSTVERLVGIEHPAYANALALEGTVLLRSGDAAGALERLETALPMMMANLGPAAHEVTLPMLAVAEAQLRLGRVREPHQLLTYSLAIRSEARDFGPDDEAALYMAPFSSALGGFYTAIGFLEEAEEHLTDALDAYEESLEDGHPDFEQVFAHMASLAQAKGDDGVAAVYRARARGIHAANLGFALVESAPQAEPFPAIPPASDPNGLFTETTVGDWVEYGSEGDPMERYEVVRATPAIVEVGTFRYVQNEWAPSGLEVIRRDIGFAEYIGVDTLETATCPFLDGEIECHAATSPGSYSAPAFTVFFAPQAVPLGGLLARVMDQQTVRLTAFRRGGETVTVPISAPFPTMVQRAREIRSASELTSAAREGDLAAVRAAVEGGMDPGIAPFRWAVREDHLDVAAFLLGQGVDPEPNQLVHAAGNGNLEMLRLLLEHGMDINAHGTFGLGNETPLGTAAENGHHLVVEFLLERGADPQATGGDGTTVLMAAAKGGQVELARRFLDLGVDLHARTRSFEPTVADSAENARRAARGLEPTGAGWSALLRAAGSGNPEMVRFLLEVGADATNLTRGGGTALYVAAPTGNVAVGELLVAAGTDPNGNIGIERTALMAASEEGHVGFVQLLIAAGADVNATNAYGYTALKGAEGRGHSEVVEVLRAAGAR
jgi:ankyrin repeat protein/tetratricopeptide (TPR) repeat protein